MSRPRAATVAAFLTAIIVWQPRSCVAAEKEFFSVSLSLVGDDVFLSNERIWFLVRVSNPNREGLSYMPVNKGTFISRVAVELFRDGNRLRPCELLRFFGPALSSGTRVRALPPGGALEALWSPSPYFELTEGKYTAIARVHERRESFGLATGEAVSNEIEFTIVGWEAEETVLKRLEEKGLGEIFFGLIRTTDGDVLAAWRYTDRAVWRKVIPVARGVALDEMLWTADSRACVIIVPESAGIYAGEKRQVIVAHRSTGFVERFPLDGGLAEGGITRVPSFLKKAPAEPGTEGLEEEKQEVLKSGKDSASLLVCLFCGSAFGAAVTGLACWLLMRRKRRAA